MNSTPASLILRLTRSPVAETWRRFVLLFTPLLDQWARRLGAQNAEAKFYRVLDLLGQAGWALTSWPRTRGFADVLPYSYSRSCA